MATSFISCSTFKKRVETALERRGFTFLPPALLCVMVAACAGTPRGDDNALPLVKAIITKDEQSAANTATMRSPSSPGSSVNPVGNTPHTPGERERMVTTYTVKKGDDMLEIARAHDLGFLELRAANPDVDPWLPKPGSLLTMPTIHLLAAHSDHGLMINLAEMRLYRFDKGQVKETHPLGIGREGLETPTGTTRVIRLAKNPPWHPTARMRAEHPEWPAVIGPGPHNPLGSRAIYLGWDLYRIHGTNIPWGVGRRVSSGCLRMYPEDVEPFFDQVRVGMPVTVVNKRLVAEWRDGRLWVEVYPTAEGWDALEAHEAAPDMPLTTDMVAEVIRVVPKGVQINWKALDRAVGERRGYPVVVSSQAPTLKSGPETTSALTVLDAH